MCIRAIIDANLFGDLQAAKIKPLLRWIDRKDGLLVYSDAGEYSDELKKSRKTLELFIAYRRQGSATLIRGSGIEAAKGQITGRELRSNDAHIIALARASEAMVLCTDDELLKRDFLNKDLLPNVGNDARAVYPLNAARGTQRNFVGKRKCANRRRS